VQGPVSLDQGDGAFAVVIAVVVRCGADVSVVGAATGGAGRLDSSCLGLVGRVGRVASGIGRGCRDGCLGVLVDVFCGCFAHEISSWV
jgi:hypothetical protein